MGTHPATTPVYAVLKAISDPTVRRIWPHEVIGAENMPNGPAIIASNHLAFCDSVFIPLAVKPTVNFLAKSDYFTTPGFKGRAMAAFFRSVGQLPMDRSGGEKSRASLEAGLKVLRAGGVLGIYPEGTRSPDGRYYRPKIGVARLALESGAPVVPVGQLGTDLIQPAGTNRPRFRHNGKPITVRTIIGKPLEFAHLQDKANDHATLRAVTDQIAEAIRALSGQQYVPVPADKVKRLMAAHGWSAQTAVASLLTH